MRATIECDVDDNTVHDFISKGIASKRNTLFGGKEIMYNNTERQNFFLRIVDDMSIRAAKKLTTERYLDWHWAAQKSLDFAEEWLEKERVELANQGIFYEVFGHHTVSIYRLNNSQPIDVITISRYKIEKNIPDEMDRPGEADYIGAPQFEGHRVRI